jgi:hypothetical protein
MNWKARLLATLTFLGGLYYFLDFVLPAKLPDSLGGYEFGKYNQEISRGFIAIGSVAFALGLINIFYIHGARIIFRKKGFLNSIALLISLVAMVIFTTNEWLAFEQVNKYAENIRNIAAYSRQIQSDLKEKKESTRSPNARIELLIAETEKIIKDSEASLSEAKSDLPHIVRDGLIQNIKLVSKENNLLKIKNESEVTAPIKPLDSVATALIKLSGDRQQLEEHLYKSSTTKALYDFVYDGLFVPLGAAMFSLLGFYIISAGYRAFRIRSIESGLMMIAAVIVMLGQIPFYIYVSDVLPDLRLWLLEYPSAAAFRAIKFGAAIAGLYMAIRMWFSIETSSFAEDNSGKAGGNK